MEEIIEGLDPEAARLAFEALLPLLDAQRDVRTASTDIRRAIIHAAAIGRLVRKPDMQVEFESLPGAALRHPARLSAGVAALATWYTVLTLRRASALSTGAKLPEELLTEGGALKLRMFKVIEYMLGHLSGVSTQLADIRTGKGYVDLAEDLMQLADLFEAHAAALAEDRTHYRVEDAVNAKKIGHGILLVLGDGRVSDARYWAEYQALAWTLLVTTYEEVSAAGQWLFRHENGEARFPSLYTVGRQSRRARRPARPTASCRTTGSTSRSPRASESPHRHAPTRGRMRRGGQRVQRPRCRARRDAPRGLAARGAGQPARQRGGL